MYNIYNKSEVYFCWEISKQKEYLIGTEKDLIHWLANNYCSSDPIFWECGSELRNPILENFGCNPNETNKEYQIFDGLGRCINPKIYEREARLLYLNYYKHQKDKRYYSYWRKSNIKYVFRFDPVPYTSKWRGGPSTKPRHIRPLKKMYYAYPEYKNFNRGSHKDVPDGWWDDWYRCNQKNWKSQSKRRHQWKEKEVSFSNT